MQAFHDTKTFESPFSQKKRTIESHFRVESLIDYGNDSTVKWLYKTNNKTY